ncbi:MAG: GNAT family N-acetyltransferase [Clostridia bacterium]|nr:GNAT family N-acetyltransferase [Clostridia bacterium]
MSEITCRPCGPKDLNAMMALQEKVCAALENKELYVASDAERNGYILEKQGVIGAFCGERLVGYCSFIYPGTKESDYARHLGWDETLQPRCGAVDSAVVDPEFRGQGLQKRMARLAVEEMRKKSPDGILLTTISPYNPASLRSMQAVGFAILHQKKMYGGKDRCILAMALNGKPLPEVRV